MNELLSWQSGKTQVHVWQSDGWMSWSLPTQKTRALS